ncbi:MAG: hypothetical protein KIT31_25685 [Deltaproteobacteria bacterium]|nr:hypothetical protein [Deltaproteobacteria bacterium]
MRRKGGHPARMTTRSGRRVRRGRLVVRPLAATGEIDADELVLDQVHDAGGPLERIAIDAAGGRVRVAVVGERTAVSTNGRAFYRRVPAPGVARALAASDGTLAVVCANPPGVWRSTDLATTWRPIELATKVLGYGLPTTIHRDRFGTWWLGTSLDRLIASRQVERGWRQAPFAARGATLAHGVAEVHGIGDVGAALWVQGVGWSHLWNGRVARSIEVGGGPARWVGEDGELVYALGTGGALYRSGDRGHTFVQIGEPHAAGMSNLRRCGWIAGALFAVAGRELLRWSGGAWHAVPIEGRVVDFASWGDGALVATAAGRILRFASRRDRFWARTADELAPVWPHVERAPETAASAPSHREEVYADLAREAALAHEELSAELRAAYRADDLERAVDEAEPGADEDAAFTVLLDRMHAAGDPRAELAAVLRTETFFNLHEADGVNVETWRLWEETGDLRVVPYAERWHAGHIAHARCSFWDGATPEDARAAAASLLDGPAGRFLRELELEVPGDGHGAALAALVAERYRPALRRLVIDGTRLAARLDLGALWAALPNLRELTVIAAQPRLGEIVLPRLQAMTVTSTGLPPREVRAIASGLRPDLRRLDVEIGRRADGGTARVDDFGPIFDGAGLPRLASLALRRCELGDALLARIAGSALLPQLRTLALRTGTITDDGARILVAHEAAFRHLASLDLVDNLLSPDGRALLARTSLKVSVEAQREDPGVTHLRVLPA